VDRRQFLVSLGRAGLAGGLASIVGACAPSVPTLAPLATRRPAAFGTAPSEAPPSASTAPTAVPAQRDSTIADENRRPGGRGWDLRSAVGPPAVEGFVDAASVAPGDQLVLHLHSRIPADIDVSWYRLGWYGGTGGRLLHVERGLRVGPGGSTVVDPASGLAEAPWPTATTLAIPADWPTGLYKAVFRPAAGTPGCTAFVVRPPARGVPAPVLFVSAATTWQAYNVWGGADFYDATATDPSEMSSGRRAVEVSFDRPYLLNRGAGYQPNWEQQFVRWQEREGRSVEYCADVDLELHPELLAGRRLIVFAGHHEYWSRPMRTALEGAIGSGINVAFLSANEVYWQVRFAPSPLGPARRVTCYKSAALDPLAATQPTLATTRWREPPVNDPEAPLVGQMYGHIVRRPADWVVLGAKHWLYEGTGLVDGDRIVNLVGQEYDTFFPGYSQPGTQILARSPVEAVVRGVDPTPGPKVHTATIYTADSGATVFAAGTFQWSWALDSFGERSYRGRTTPPDERVERMTRNLFDRLGDGSV
jgi:hypothetical protein